MNFNVICFQAIDVPTSTDTVYRRGRVTWHMSLVFFRLVSIKSDARGNRGYYTSLDYKQK